MKPVNIYFIAVVLFFLLPVVKMQGQPIAGLEKKYASVSSSLDNEQRKLDSLTLQLNDRAESISREKQKASPDREKITRLMANSVLLTNTINDLQKKIISLENKKEDLKSILRNSYTRIIDSLSNLPGKTNENELQILSFTAKKLLVAQRFPDLSFQPDMIINLNPSSVNNPEEKRIFRDYVNRALKEIEEKIIYIDKQYNEINSILALQKKADKFLEETEYNDEYGFSRNRRNLTEAGRDVEFNNSKDYLSNAENVSGMLNQFRTIQPSENKQRSNLTTNVQNLSLKDYHKLLKELRENLTAFKTILLHKAKLF